VATEGRGPGKVVLVKLRSAALGAGLVGACLLAPTRDSHADPPLPGHPIPVHTSAALRNDFPAIPAPAGYGHYCSLSYPGGLWAFSTTGPGTDPCGDMLKSSPGGKIERAGLWHTSGPNNVLVRCGGDVRIYKDDGSKATAKAFTDAGDKKGCVFTVSAVSLPVFGKPYGTPSPIPEPDVSHTNGFDYAQFGKQLDPTMFGQSGGPSSIVDRFGRGHASGQDGHDAHDYPMPKGKPIRAVAEGLVLAARSRDVTSFNCGTTDEKKFQTEIYVLHAIGTGEYQERFVSYYAHLDTMAVVTGANVTRGQQLGTAGTRGCSSTPHLHLGVTRIRNLTGARFLAFAPTPDGHGDNGFGSRIDPYGWQAPKHVDPWAWMYLGDFKDAWLTYHDPGAFSVNLWLPGFAPPAANW